MRRPRPIWSRNGPPAPLHPRHDGGGKLLSRIVHGQGPTGLGRKNYWDCYMSVTVQTKPPLSDSRHNLRGRLGLSLTNSWGEALSPATGGIRSD
jgi:hypothetical protein